jgi:hypothetical protein
MRKYLYRHHFETIKIYPKRHLHRSSAQAAILDVRSKHVFSKERLSVAAPPHYRRLNGASRRRHCLRLSISMSVLFPSRVGSAISEKEQVVVIGEIVFIIA